MCNAGGSSCKCVACREAGCQVVGRGRVSATVRRWQCFASEVGLQRAAGTRAEVHVGESMGPRKLDGVVCGVYWCREGARVCCGGGGGGGGRELLYAGKSSRVQVVVWVGLGWFSQPVRAALLIGPLVTSAPSLAPRRGSP
jgi:hypothetical protein